jgi:DHA1 family bicyclomycin/chloramphenicol resistance-like MFS transporter
MFKFATILFIQILCGMEMDLFIPSFPELQKVFHLSPVMVQLTISANFMAFCICSLFAGALGDKYNRRTVLISGLLIFVLGSVVCVTAPNFVVLILGRILQGIGISAPAILSFPVLLEDCSADKQPGMVGMINGAKTLAMAIAPVIGSFVNLYFNWRANFSLLLGLGMICLIASYFSIPHKLGNNSVSLSLKTYLPLLKSRKYLTFFMGLSFLTAAYWLFAAMAPIIYIEDMGVSLKHFGYYQGSLSFTFAVVCIISPMLFSTFGQKRCLYFGLGLCVISVILLVGLILIETREPLIVTAVLIIFSIAVVFPINILYPISLEVVPHTKGRSAGLGQTMLLLLTASLIETVSYFYNGWFMPIGLAMVLSIMMSLALIQIIIYKKWLHLVN